MYSIRIALAGILTALMLACTAHGQEPIRFGRVNAVVFNGCPGRVVRASPRKPIKTENEHI